MKTTRAGQSRTSPISKSALTWYLCLAGAFLGFGLSLSVLLLSAKTESGASTRMPPGQLQADTRTVFAALQFLLDNGPAVQSSPSVVSKPANASIASGLLGATGQPCEMLACPSNQTELNCETCFTNSPVRS
ncbi:MAG: hypothetical protein U1F83_03800 [Verrucomicrobiota bacterium]